MYAYEITSDGYRLYWHGELKFVQEGRYATVYPGDTMEERAQNHIDDMTGVPDEKSGLAEETQLQSTAQEEQK